MMIKRVTSLILKFLFSTVAMTPCFFSNICNHILYSFLNREKTSFLASLFKRGRYNLTYTNVCKHTLDKIKYVYTYYYFITSYIEKGEPSIITSEYHVIVLLRILRKSCENRSHTLNMLFILFVIQI